MRLNSGLYFTGGAQTGNSSTSTGGIFLTWPFIWYLVNAEEGYNELHTNSVRRGNFFCAERAAPACVLGHALVVLAHMTTRLALVIAIV